MPAWGKPKKLSDEAKQFLQMTRQGFGDGDWSFIAQKTLANQYVSRPMRASWIPDCLDKLKVDDNCNIYTTANAFSSNQGNRTSYLFSMHHLVADIDCHSKSIRPEARTLQIDNLVHTLKHGSDYGILEPNYVVYTGRGVQIWWHHEALSAKSNMWTWQSVAKRLTICLDTILADLGKDPVDGCPNLELDKTASFNPAGYYRLPGTINQNTKTQVSMEVLHDHTFSLAELKAFRDEVPLPPVDFVPKQAKDHKLWARKMLTKLYTLREMRDAEPGDELRNNYCFVVYCTLRTAGYDRNKALELVSHFNEGFKEPFSESELRTCLSSAVRKHYKLSSKSIIELLGITMPEREELCIGIGVDVTKLQRKRRQEAKVAAMAERKAKITELYATQKYTMKQIGEMVGLSKAVVSKILHPMGFTFRRDAAIARDAKIIECWNKGWSYAEIAEEVGCGRATIQRAIHNEKVRQAEDADVVSPAEVMSENFVEAEKERPNFLSDSTQKSFYQGNNGCLYPSGARKPNSAPHSFFSLSRRSWVYGDTPLPSPLLERWQLRLDGWGHTLPSAVTPTTPPKQRRQSARRGQHPSPSRRF